MSSYLSGTASPTPPAPPPKPGSDETSRMGTPSGPKRLSFHTQPPHPPLPPATEDGLGDVSAAAIPLPQPEIGPDPGENWLPGPLHDKSAQDLTEILGSPSLLNALSHASQTMHPTLATSHATLKQALTLNAQLAQQLSALAARLSRQRSTTQAQLLATHAIERQWRQKQSDLDHALAPFSPASLYQRLAIGVQEQAAVCRALEDSLLDTDGDAEADGPVSEREVVDWVRRYREAKVQLYLRQERKERWDEGRVGGWR